MGYDNIDIEAASKYGVAVFNTPNLMNNAVADLTIGLFISLLEKFVKEIIILSRKNGEVTPGIFFGEIVCNQKV